MAFSKAVTLCLLLTLSSGLAGPLTGVQTSRKLLQSSTFTSTSSSTAAANQLLSAFNSGASGSDLQSLLTNFFSIAPPAQQQATIGAALQSTQGNQAATNTLANGLASTGQSNPGLATSIGNAVSGAVGNPSSSSGNTATGSDASSILKVFSDGGISSGTVTSLGAAQATATNAIATAVSTALAAVDGKSCTQSTITATAQACAKAIGTACATAITSVSAQGSVSGTGSVQGVGTANAQAFAQAFSSAIAQAFAKATNGKDKAVAAVQSSAATSAIAQACSSSLGAINQQGAGTATTSVTTISQSFQQAVSTAVANAVAFVGASKCSDCTATAGR